jgi:hypothetical protein
LALCALAVGLPQTALAADADNDGIPDNSDACPTENGEGVSNGCPALHTIYLWNGRDDHRGFRFGSLIVESKHATRIEVACRASTTCPRRKVVNGHHHRVVLKQFSGLLAPKGMVVEIRVSRPGHLGEYLRFRMSRSGAGAPLRRCMNPGSRVPRRQCDPNATGTAPLPTLVPWLDPYPAVAVVGEPAGTGTHIRRIAVQRLPRGATVRVACTGHGCGRRHRTLRGRAAKGDLGLAGKTLAAGAVVEVSVTKGSTVGLYVRLRMRRHGRPARAERCLVPGSSRPRVCPVRP